MYSCVSLVERHCRGITFAFIAKESWNEKCPRTQYLHMVHQLFEKNSKIVFKSSQTLHPGSSAFNDLGFGVSLKDTLT